MFFKKSKYPLPKFPSTVISTFKRLRGQLNETQRQEIETALNDFVGRFRGDSHPRCLARLPIAEVLYDRSKLLLDMYETLPPKKQALVGAAVRYVVVADDPFSDESFLTGLDDDVRIMNYVLEQLELWEEIIQLERH